MKFKMRLNELIIFQWIFFDSKKVVAKTSYWKKDKDLHSRFKIPIQEILTIFLCSNFFMLQFFRLFYLRFLRFLRVISKEKKFDWKNFVFQFSKKVRKIKFWFVKGYWIECEFSFIAKEMCTVKVSLKVTS